MQHNQLSNPILLGISGYSGSGKTTLLEKLIPKLTALRLRVAVIKHTHHNVQLDKPGKDSYRMAQVGAAQVMMACDQRWALMTETPKSELNLAYLAQQFDKNLVDLILVEGFKNEPIDKLLVHRQAVNKPLPLIDQYVQALITEADWRPDSTLTVPKFDINDIEQIAHFVHQYYLKRK